MVLSNNILNIFTENNNLSLKDVIGRLIAILGIRGSGKTNTSAVIIEEILNKGIPLSIIDTDGEYWSLKEISSIFLIGSTDISDLKIDLSKDINFAKIIAEITYRKKIPVIIDVSDYHPAEVISFLEIYLNTLWNLANRFRIPYFIVIEEAHEFIPQRPLDYHKRITHIITRLALRGRKRGFGMILISQRSAKVSKDVLTQAELLFLHKIVHPADLNVYKELLPLSPSEVKEKAIALRVGEVLFYHNGYVERRSVRLRRTFHPGYTPMEPSNILKWKTSDLQDLAREISMLAKNLKKEQPNKPLIHIGSVLTTPIKSNDIKNPLKKLIINNSSSETNYEVRRKILKRNYTSLNKEDRSISIKNAYIKNDANICLSKDDIVLLSKIISLSSKLPLTMHLYINAIIQEYPNAIDVSNIARKINRKTVNTKILNKLTRKRIIKKMKIGRKTYYKFNIDYNINISSLKRFYSELINNISIHKVKKKRNIKFKKK